MAAAAAAPAGESAGELLLRAAALVPLTHYALAALAVASAFLYRFLELHLLGDLLRGFRGGRVALTFHPASHVYHRVASKCRSLHGRYLATPWLASPHLLTLFLSIWGRPPSFTYRRQLYTVRDGGTIALDWLLASDCEGPDVGSCDGIISEDNSTPLVVVIPGLTSDSTAAYVKHLVFSMANKGWNVVVSNHRGLGGISITSDCFYNAGWTEDIREVVNYLHQKHPEAPLFTVGTSIGANILVKYLGEEGQSTPVAGSVSICSPWDLLVTNRFISRKLVQRCYDRALAIGLKGYAKLHQPVLARLANWEAIRTSRSIREFDHHATCVVAKYETVDTFYRRCSSANYIGNVSVPLLCISALDDPLCTREAIPWDECRANKNVVLATTPNGGHLAFFQGLTAGRLWWVGAVSEFLSALHDSPYMHRQKKEEHGLHSSLESTIDKSPYVNFMEDGMVAAVTNDGANNDDSLGNQIADEMELSDGMVSIQQNGTTTEIQNQCDGEVENKSSSEENVTPTQGPVGSQERREDLYISYDTADDMYCDRNLEGELGAPVGAWASCSISEAAYGALDHPVNGLEDSPLMKLQEVLKCNKGTNSVDHFGLLFLSKNLKKYRYGFEYASLEVKDHLERVDFSDVVDTVMILYDGCGIQKTKASPWITHFHLSQEMMKRKRLRLGFVVEELTEQYNVMRDQLNNAIPSVCILKGKCSVGNECVKNQTCCITMVAQAEANSTSQLDTIKKRVIPIILATLLKGFLEFKDVEIQCQHDSELVVKVGMSEHCKSGKFWATLQNACVPIMELIDWELSRPESVYDIFCSYGIDSAWKYFVESLRSTTDDIGRNIRREHLLVVADCLSVSGQFHGLSCQGLKQQRTRLSISSPFSEACFSRPAHSFINAAKQCSVDNLCGTLDAIAWGKEPSTGTSGPFKIMYSGKSHEPIQNENIYDFLHNPEVRGFEKNCMDTCGQSSENASKRWSACKSEGNAFCNGGTISVNQKFLDAEVGIWDNIIDMRTCLQNMLREYPLNEYVMEPDKSLLIEALKFHPRGYEKIGAGIRYIKIGLNPSHPGTRCFVLLRNDDTTEDFSYRKCVHGAANSISPELGSYIEKILYHRAIFSH